MISLPNGEKIHASELPSLVSHLKEQKEFINQCFYKILVDSSYNAFFDDKLKSDYKKSKNFWDKIKNEL